MIQSITYQNLAKEGDSAYKRGDYLVSANSFHEAAEVLRADGDELFAAEMLNNCSVAYLQAGEAQLALEAVEGTSEIFAAAGDLYHQAMAIGNRAAALDELERFEEAEEAYIVSAKILREVGKHDDQLHVLQSLSALQMKMGRRLEAYASMYAGVMAIDRPNPRQRLLKALLQIPYKLFN